jgi:hypothetical protein
MAEPLPMNTLIFPPISAADCFRNTPVTDLTAPAKTPADALPHARLGKAAFRENTVNAPRIKSHKRLKTKDLKINYFELNEAEPLQIQDLRVNSLKISQAARIAIAHLFNYVLNRSPFIVDLPRLMLKTIYFFLRLWKTF